MAIGSQNTLSDLDRRAIAHALMCAENAIRDMGRKAQDGPRGRPTVATLNRTMERLASIQNLLTQVLGPNTLAAAPKIELPPIPHASTNEKLIVGKLVTDILAAGQNLSIWNGGDKPEIKHSRDAASIFAAMAASGQDEIVVYNGIRRSGWIRLVWGNDVDVISDYSIKLETLLAGANSLAEELS